MIVLTAKQLDLDEPVYNYQEHELERIITTHKYGVPEIGGMGDEVVVIVGETHIIIVNHPSYAPWEVMPLEHLPKMMP